MRHHAAGGVDPGDAARVAEHPVEQHPFQLLQRAGQPPQRARRVLELARLDKVFTIHADLATALAEGGWYPPKRPKVLDASVTNVRHEGWEQKRYARSGELSGGELARRRRRLRGLARGVRQGRVRRDLGVAAALLRVPPGMRAPLGVQDRTGRLLLDAR